MRSQCFAHNGIACTFEVLGRKQNCTEVMVFDEVSDVWRHRGAIKAHHEELAQRPGCMHLANAPVEWGMVQAHLSVSSHAGSNSGS